MTQDLRVFLFVVVDSGPFLARGSQLRDEGVLNGEGALNDGADTELLERLSSRSEFRMIGLLEILSLRVRLIWSSLIRLSVKMTLRSLVRSWSASPISASLAVAGLYLGGRGLMIF